MSTNRNQSATELLAQMHALEAKLALTVCRCCGRPLNIFVQPGMLPTSPVYQYGTCFNVECDRYSITLEVGALYNLTDEQVVAFSTRIHEAS